MAGLLVIVTPIQSSQPMLRMDEQHVIERTIFKETRVPPGTLFSMLVVAHRGPISISRFMIPILVPMIRSPLASTCTLLHFLVYLHVDILSTLLEALAPLHLIYTTLQ